METIFKTWKKATYFEGQFEIYKNKMAHPIHYPTVFVGYGRGIKSGNWNRCTSINTPTYVIDKFFDSIGHNIHDNMYPLFKLCKELERITWGDVKDNENYVLELINLANEELNKLKTLK